MGDHGGVSGADWSRGWWWTWARFGVPSGLLFGLLQLGWQSRSTASAAEAAILFGVLFGATMTVIMRCRAKGLAGLDRSQRIAVTTAVHEGQDITDRRLAPAVVEYAEEVRKQQVRQGSFGGIQWGVAAICLIVAIGVAISGHVRAVAFLVVSMAFAAQAFRLSSQGRRTLTSAERAESAARRLLTSDEAGAAAGEALPSGDDSG
jgi:hypothetical protein